jgi:hypothetical protein
VIVLNLLHNFSLLINLCVPKLPDDVALTVATVVDSSAVAIVVAVGVGSSVVIVAIVGSSVVVVVAAGDVRTGTHLNFRQVRLPCSQYLGGSWGATQGPQKRS